MIPKIANFFWHGGPMSWLRYTTLSSFRQYNPEWEIRLYTPTTKCSVKTWKSAEMDDQGYSGKDYLEELEPLNIKKYQWVPPIQNLSPAHACDLFEWDILSTVGGVYSDMDILYVRPIEAAYLQMKEKDAVFCLESESEMAIGFFMSSPNCQLFRAIYNKALDFANTNNYQCFGTEAVYRSVNLWPVNLRKNPDTGCKAVERFRSNFSNLKIARLSKESVYPYAWQHVDKIFNGTYTIPSDCFGIHWFGGAPLAQDINRRWTENNHPHSSTFCRMLH